ncbi:MAG: hypothetical protein Q9191_000030 [Dirinaria sp. TL-2023a]
MQDLLDRSIDANISGASSLKSEENALGGLGVHEDFDTEGISAEELKYWAQIAPEDQRLALVEEPTFEETINSRSSHRLTSEQAVARVELFVRSHHFFQKAATSFTTSERRKFERDTYDFARSMSFSKRDAKKQVIKARHLCGEADYDSEQSALGGEVDDPAAVTNIKSTQAGTLISDQGSTRSDQQSQDPAHAPCKGIPAGDRSQSSKKRKSRTGSGSATATNAKKRKCSNRNVHKGHELSSTTKDCRSHRANKDLLNRHHDRKADLRGNGVASKPNITMTRNTAFTGRSLGVDSTKAQSPAKSSGRNGIQGRVESDQRGSDGNLSSPLLNGTEEPKLAKHLERRHKRNLRRQRRKEQRLSQMPINQARSPAGIEAASPEASFAGSSSRPSNEVQSLEPRSQKEAHENFVRSMERDPDEHGRFSGREKKAGQQSQEMTPVLNAELRALNADTRKQQINSFNQGILRKESKALKDDIKDMKAEQEELEEDERAGMTAADEGASFDHPHLVLVPSLRELPEPACVKKRRAPKNSTKARANENEEGLANSPQTLVYKDIDTRFPWSDSDLSSAPSSPVPPSPVLERYKLLSAPKVYAKDSPHHSSSPAISTPSSTPSTKAASKARLVTKRKLSAPKISPYFPTPPTAVKSKTPRSKRPAASCIPFPPLSSSRFGLVQEALSTQPFRLLIAVIFLNKTRGAVALPVFFALMERYPTPEALAEAELEDIVGFFSTLGLQNQRAKKVLGLAKEWVSEAPSRGRRWRRKDYPQKRDGRDIRAEEEPIADDDEDPRVAWEVGRLPGIGAYGIDSWRIFCRDRLRGIEAPIMSEYVSPLPSTADEGGDTHDNDKKAEHEMREKEMKGEWTRVLPLDKELRAYLRWRWLRLGWQWDPLTGERSRASEQVMREAEGGGVIVEGEGGGRVATMSEEPKSGEDGGSNNKILNENSDPVTGIDCREKGGKVNASVDTTEKEQGIVE